MIFEPIFDTVLMKIVLNVAWQHHYFLFYIEFAKANAALILVCHSLRTPLDLEHLFKHFRCLSLLLLEHLGSLEPLVEEVRDEACEQNSANNEDDRREGSDD